MSIPPIRDRVQGAPEAADVVGAEGQNRTGDTAIFSRVLYRLSYLGPDQESLAHGFYAENVDSIAPCGPLRASNYDDKSDVDPRDLRAVIGRLGMSSTRTMCHESRAIACAIHPGGTYDRMLTMITWEATSHGGVEFKHVGLSTNVVDPARMAWPIQKLDAGFSSHAFPVHVIS
jgi:hypothetical protein